VQDWAAAWRRSIGGSPAPSAGRSRGPRCFLSARLTRAAGAQERGGRCACDRHRRRTHVDPGDRVRIRYGRGRLGSAAKREPFVCKEPDRCPSAALPSSPSRRAGPGREVRCTKAVGHAPDADVHQGRLSVRLPDGQEQIASWSGAAGRSHRMTGSCAPPGEARASIAGPLNDQRQQRAGHDRPRACRYVVVLSARWPTPPSAGVPSSLLIGSRPTTVELGSWSPHSRPLMSRRAPRPDGPGGCWHPTRDLTNGSARFDGPSRLGGNGISCALVPRPGVRLLPEVARLTTILTTIRVRSTRSAVVRGGSDQALTCGYAHSRTTADLLPTTGGQGVAGSNPVSPTVKPRVRGGSTGSVCRPLACT
jgi:hypothetical protein